MKCVSTTSFSVAFNGSFHGFFLGKRGLRQGDPISPALFLLSIEYFSPLVKRKTSDSEFNFHPKCVKLKITHLFFADDLILFSRGDLPSIHILMECLQEFRDVYGIVVNTSKSSIFTRAPVAWEEICHPKEEGGLGILHIQTWNVALLARVLWKIHRMADTLCVQWVNGVYLRCGSVWDWQLKKGDAPLLQWLVEIGNRLVTKFGSSEALIQHMKGWTNSKGLETSKAYEHFRLKPARQLSQTTIWKAFIPPKYSFILWLGLLGRLATHDRLSFLQEEEACSLCINKQETARHLFFECPFSDFVWSHIRH
ncbi:UNVERIFIED_CONTAM: hypothetical protein Sradi_0735600 [Sesamum radiatum]|uniref:Reverse transcriptase domain-containing protein n=1 Tax=Sesamum radiatum TaxID=300843 RepID=A0AAW2VTB2_SESRA